MDKIIIIDKLTFRYNDKFIFDRFSLEIKRGDFVTIAGANGSGKTTLLKIITGLINTDNDISICNLKLNKNNIDEIRKNIGIVFDNPDNYFVCETVFDDMAFNLENLCYDKKYIKDRIYTVSSMLHINNLLNKSVNELSGGEKCKVQIACALIHNPKILLIDETLSMIDEENKKEILKILKDLNKKGLTIINVTHDLSESYNSNRLIIINNGEIMLDGVPMKVMEYDRILNKLGIAIPFEVELSLKLKLYGLIDKIYLNMEEMVDDIWE